ncbi:hypothetical protein J3R30DRAFT_3696009 [Lentinula aciculospora]|uniref:YEATS domain-containing protein n=1 Tax=Lentinula aciculospora TaxID=153920 RepID=A0A9W9AQI7_9AGAR|nr:hypothetical protein J3R30DRAFT_3696009 [Lentinula aciculospora]
MVPNKRIKLDTTDEQRNAIIISEIDIELGLRKRLAQTLESRIAWASLLLESLKDDTEIVSEVPFKDVALNALTTLESSSDILFAPDVIEVPPQNTVQKGRLPPKEKPITRSQRSKFLYLRSQDSHRTIFLRCSICHQTAFNNLQGLFNHGRILHSTDWGSHEECVKACAVPQEELDGDLDLEGGVDVGRGMLLPGVKGLFQMAVEGTRDGNSSFPSELDSEESAGRSIHLTKTLGLHSDSPALAQFLGKEVKRKGIKVWDSGDHIDITTFNVNNAQTPRWRKRYIHRNPANVEEEVIIHKDRDSRLAAANSSLGVPDSTIMVSSRFHISCRVTLTDSSLFIPEEQRIKEKRDHTHQWMVCAESASYSLDLTTVLTAMTVMPISPSDLDSPVSFFPLVTSEPPFLVVGTTSEPFQARIELMFNPSTSGPGQNGQKVILEHWVGLDMIGINKLPTKGDEQVVDVELDKDTILKPAKIGYISVKARSHWESVSNISSGNEVKPQVADTVSSATVEPTIPASYNELLEFLLAQFPMTLTDLSQYDSKITSNVPYKLPTDSTQLKSLITGRRKAIEWARAKALQGAYINHIQVLRKRDPCSHLICLTTGDVYAWMEDNGHFVREEPRTTQVNELDFKQNDSLPIGDYSEGRWCRVCGLGLWAHGTRGLEYVKTEVDLVAAAAAQAKEAEEKQSRLPKIRIRLLDGKVVGAGPSAPPPLPRPEPFQCQIVVKMLQLSKMPIVDVQRILRTYAQKEIETSSMLNPRQLPPWSSRTHRLVRDHSTLVSAMDPRMILGIRSVVHTLHFPSFSLLHSPMLFPSDRIGGNAAEVEANLSPYALLALATKQFIRVLIKEAAEVEKRDKELGVGLLFETHHRDVSLLASGLSSRKYKNVHSINSGRKGREKDKIKMQSIKVLTPMHIIAGVVSNYVRATALATVPSESRPGIPVTSMNNESGVGIAMFGCLSRIGTGVERENEL